MAVPGGSSTAFSGLAKVGEETAARQLRLPPPRFAGSETAPRLLNNSSFVARLPIASLAKSSAESSISTTFNSIGSNDLKAAVCSKAVNKTAGGFSVCRLSLHRLLGRLAAIHDQLVHQGNGFIDGKKVSDHNGRSAVHVFRIHIRALRSQEPDDIANLILR